jgi:electron transfer flavoprotein beta subunit
MKILVPTKRVPDTDQKIRVKPDRLSIDDTNLPFVINPFDAVALEEALRIRESASRPVEVVAVGIGSLRYESELRIALAMGADRAVLVRCDESLDPWNVARILREVVTRERPDMVLMGKQAVDDDANQTGQFLAALLGWPQATFASRIELMDDSARVSREVDAGIETVRIALPAVITSDLRLNEPRYASLPSIMRVRKKPIEDFSLDELGIVVEPRVHVRELVQASTTRNCVRLDSVDELVEQLRKSRVS